MKHTYHHTSSKRGYVSRKNPNGIKQDYKGKYGEGYVILRPRFDTSRYIYIDYYIKEEE